MGIQQELREMYPEWARVTPAKRRILEHLIAQGGTVQYWPGHVLRSLRPLRMLEYVGFVQSWQRAEDRYSWTQITDDGRQALAAAQPPQQAASAAATKEASGQSRQEGKAS